MGGGPTSTSAMEGSRSGGMESEAALAAAEAGGGTARTRNLRSFQFTNLAAGRELHWKRGPWEFWGSECLQSHGDLAEITLIKASAPSAFHFQRVPLCVKS